MPFRDFTGFNLATLRIMTAAYDTAIARLGIKTTDPMTSALALKIVALAKAGERDPNQICDRALAELGQ